MGSNQQGAAVCTQFPLHQQGMTHMVDRQQFTADQGVLLVTDEATAPNNTGNIALRFQLAIGEFDGIARNSQLSRQNPAGRQFCLIAQLARRHLLFDRQVQRSLTRHPLS
ncbi:hypothetical protein D3C79_873970 [compost metagenome]